MTPPNPDHGPWTTVEDREGSPFRVRFRVGQLGGRRAITHLCIEPNPKATAAPRPLTARDLAAIKPAELLAQDDAFMRLLLDPEQGMTTRPTRYGEEEYAAIRDLLVRCAQEGTSARTVLMKSWGVKARTADRLIATTRERFPDAPRATRSGGHGTTSEEQQ